MINTLLIQGIGAIGYSTLAFSYYKEKKEQILLMQIIAYIFFTVHYYLLNGITGAICNLIGLVALVTIYVFEKYNLGNKLFISITCMLAVFLINIITFQNFFSIFPIIASIIVIISFLDNNEKNIRIIGVIAAVCWLIYAIAYKSYISIVFEVFTLIGVFIALLKNNNNIK